MIERTDAAAAALMGAAAHLTIHAYSLRLRGIRFQMHVGASAEERAVRQEVIVDVDLSLSVDHLPDRDLLGEVVDYDGVVRRVVEAGASESYHLLETYASCVVTELLTELPALSVRVAVTKKTVPTKYPVEAAIVELVGSRPLGAPLRASRRGLEAPGNWRPVPVLPQPTRTSSAE